MNSAAARASRLKAEDAVSGLTKPATRRLARRGGCRRLARNVYPVAKMTTRAYVAKILSKAAALTGYANRKTITKADIVHAVKNQGVTLYGFGHVNF